LYQIEIANILPGRRSCFSAKTGQDYGVPRSFP